MERTSEAVPVRSRGAPSATTVAGMGLAVAGREFTARIFAQPGLVRMAARVKLALERCD